MEQGVEEIIDDRFKQPHLAKSNIKMIRFTTIATTQFKGPVPIDGTTKLMVVLGQIHNEFHIK